MSDALFDAVGAADAVRAAVSDADSLVARRVLGSSDASLRSRPRVEFNADALEAVALRAVRELGNTPKARALCLDAFELLRGLVSEDAPTRPDDLEVRLRAAALALLADRPTQARQLLDTVDAGMAAPGDADWGTDVYRSMLLLWALVIRKRGWDDLDNVHSVLKRMREVQADREPAFLAANEGRLGVAWDLVVAFHLLRAAEIVAEYQETGSVDGRFDPMEQAEVHFDRAVAAADEADRPALGFLARLMEQAARRLLLNSIWRAARGAGSRVTNFVESLASRERERPVLDLLPPQRRVLVEQGLMASGRRSIVVSLPTSAGKTLIAEFRILKRWSATSASRVGLCTPLRLARW